MSEGATRGTSSARGPTAGVGGPGIDRGVGDGRAGDAEARSEVAVEPVSAAGIAAAFRRIGLGVDDDRCRRVSAYFDLLQRRGRQIRAVGSVSASALLDLHLRDSLELALAIPRDGLGNRRLLDVGSGAGLPGILLAIARPDLAVTTIEKRRIRFELLEEAAATVGGFTPLRGTARPGWPAGYAVAVSRAVVSPSRWLTLGRTMVEPGGWVFAMWSGAQWTAWRAAGGADPDLLRRYRLDDGRDRLIAGFIR